MSDGKDNFPANPFDERPKEADAEAVEQEIEPVRIGQIASMLDELSEPKKKKVQKKTKKKQPESVFDIVEERNPEVKTEDSEAKTQKKTEKKTVTPVAQKESEKKVDVSVEQKESENKTTVPAKQKKVVKKADTSVAQTSEKGSSEEIKEETKEESKKEDKTEAKTEEKTAQKDTSAEKKEDQKSVKKKPGKKTAALIRMTALNGAEVSEEFDEEEDSEEDAEEREEAEELKAAEEEIETQLERTKTWIRDKVQKNRMLVLVTGILCLILAVYYLVHSQTYENISVISTDVIRGAVNCNYTQFEDGFIKYSQDGVAYLANNGTEKWNLAYQMADPVVEINGKTGAVFDKEGQSIVVFQKSGVIGQMETALPIEKITVSKQGIVCAVLQNEDAAMVMVYDLVGKVLVEHKTAFSGTGYPMDVALSDNGENLMVTYLYVAEGIITTKVMFYNFGDAGRNISDHQIAAYEYPGTISATCFFMDKDICVMAGDDKLVYYRGTDEPEELKVVEIDKEIRTLSYDNANIGLVLKNGKENGYEARMYDMNGDVKMSADIVGEYNHVKLCDEQMLMYDGKRCSIVLKNGVQKFQGELENVVLEIVPEGGVNKYLLVDQDGFKRIRLVK